MTTFDARHMTLSEGLLYGCADLATNDPIDSLLLDPKSMVYFMLHMRSVAETLVVDKDADPALYLRIVSGGRNTIVKVEANPDVPEMTAWIMVVNLLETYKAGEIQLCV